MCSLYVTSLRVRGLTTQRNLRHIASGVVRLKTSGQTHLWSYISAQRGYLFSVECRSREEAKLSGSFTKFSRQVLDSAERDRISTRDSRRVYSYSISRWVRTYLLTAFFCTSALYLYWRSTTFYACEQLRSLDKQLRSNIDEQLRSIVNNYVLLANNYVLYLAVWFKQTLCIDFATHKVLTGADNHRKRRSRDLSV